MQVDPLCSCKNVWPITYDSWKVGLFGISSLERLRKVKNEQVTTSSHFTTPVVICSNDLTKELNSPWCYIHVLPSLFSSDHILHSSNINACNAGPSSGVTGLGGCQLVIVIDAASPTCIMQHMPRKTPSYHHKGWLLPIPINRFCTVELNQHTFIIYSYSRTHWT